MTTTTIEIGDQVETKKSLKNGKSIMLPKGSVGKVRDYLGGTAAGPNFVVVVEGLPFRFKFWADELELMKKGKPRKRKKPLPTPTIHRQRAINLGGEMVEVDIKLAPLIQGLFRAGILTMLSCEENEPGITWLLFINTKHALRFVKAASQALEFFTWNSPAPQEDGPVSIRFPLADLPKLEQLFSAE
jgi:hypothetical protein